MKIILHWLFLTKVKYKILYTDMVANKGSLKIDLSWVESSGQKVKTVFSEYFDFYHPDYIDFVQINISTDLFVDNENSNLKIYTTDRLVLDGNQALISVFFRSVFRFRCIEKKRSY